MVEIEFPFERSPRIVHIFPQTFIYFVIRLRFLFSNLHQFVGIKNSNFQGIFVHINYKWSSLSQKRKEVPRVLRTVRNRLI